MMRYVPRLEVVIPVTDLLELVDVLTLPQSERVAQRNTDGTWRTSFVTHDPLLKQFRDAVWPSSNTAGGSASLASTRSPVDVTALFEMAKMSAIIGDWCRLVGARTTRSHDAVVDLRSWYAAYISTDMATEAWYGQQLHKFISTIRRHLNPSSGFDLMYPCPVCRRRDWGDTETGGVFPIRVEYTKTDHGTSRHRAECRNSDCRTAWLGLDAVVELAAELTGEDEDVLMDKLTEVPA